MSSEIVVEIEGAHNSHLYRIFEEENSDLLLKIFGSKTVLESTVTTDQSSQNSTKKVSLIPDSWRVVDISDVLDITTGDVDLTHQAEAADKCCLGLLRYRKCPMDPQAYSYHDHLLLRGLSRLSEQYLFLHASKEEGEGTNLGIKYKISGKITSASTDVGAQKYVEVQIKNPSLKSLDYKKAGDRQRGLIDSLMGGVKIHSQGVDEISAILENNVSKRLKSEASNLTTSITSLEKKCSERLEKIKKLQLKLSRAVENTRELKKIRGIQSNLETAVEQVTNMQQVEVGGGDALVDDNFNSSMTTNIDSPEKDLSPSF